MKILFSVLSATVLFIGCGRKEAVVVPDPTEPKVPSHGPATALINPASLPQSTAAKKDATKETAPEILLVLTQTDETVPVTSSMESLEALRAHRAVLLCKGLVPHQPYEVNWRLLDSGGREWKLSTSTTLFTPSQSKWEVWCVYRPPERPTKGGTWTWEASLKGGPTQRREFTMIVPSAAEMEGIAQYEKARETAFGAFAHRWQGHGTHYYTMMAEGMIEVAGLNFSQSSEYVSPAETLNGLNYKSTWKFSFRSFRVVGANGRWADWRDVEVRKDKISNFVGEKFNTDMPDNFKKGFDLSIATQERDGHWRAWTEAGAIFVNNRQIRPSAFARPSTEQILKALDGGSSRKEELNHAESLRDKPLTAESEVIKTMDQLRGRSL